MLKPSVAHDLAAAYAFQAVGRVTITRREFRRVVCPKLGVDKEQAKEIERDLVYRGVLVPRAQGAYGRP